jgi:hypothetical protein
MKGNVGRPAAAAVVLFLLAASPAVAQQIETFPDPLGQWTSGWLYANTNLENWVVAKGGSCPPDDRSGEPDGMWVSDDPGCGNLIKESPVRIDFASGFADTATEFSLDQYTCLSSVSFNVYDKDGVLVSTEILPSTCFTFQSYQYPLTNGISAFEWTHPDSTRVEGNTAVDNVSLLPEPGGVQMLATGLAQLGLLHRRRRG